MELIGKYIKQTWINGLYRSIWLRRIDRETSTQCISNAQRYFRNFKDGVDDRTFHSNWATRFRKTKKQILPILTKRHNPDGHYDLKIVNNPNEDLLCSYSFDELFNTDLRIIQDPKSSPRQNIERAYELAQAKGKQPIIWDSYILADYLVFEDEGNDSNHWNAPLIKFLRSMFNVPIFYLNEKVNEHWTQGKLYKSAICFHITHFNNNKEIISFDENFHNRTIAFWLFTDKLVFQYEDGKDTF